MGDNKWLEKARAKARALGVTRLERSPVAGKKLRAFVDGKAVDFGDASFEDFLTHGDSARRADYRRRHGAIRTKSGKRAVDIRGTPAWLSYNVLW